jgi:hypothetical protein
LRVKHAQAQADRLFQETIAAGKLRHAGPAGVNGLRRQGEVEQFGQYTAMGFNELGVYAGQVHLAQVNAGPWMVFQPLHHRQ